jgi:hypothetical protein
MLFVAILFVSIVGIGASQGRASSNEPGATSSASSLAGEWGVQIKLADHSEEAVLLFKLDGRSLTGSLQREGREARDLTNIQVAGEKITFDLDEITGTTRFQGAIDRNIMSGKMKRLRQPGEDGSGFSFGAPRGTPRGRRGGAREEGGGRSVDGGSHDWTAYKRHTNDTGTPEPSSLPKPAEKTTAALPSPSPEGRPADYRFHVSSGTISRKDTIFLTPEGERVALTSSFSIPDGLFVPDPYAGKCRLTAVKFTLKEEDKKAILADRYKPTPAADQDDTMVPHSVELRNAAGRFGANSIYLLLSDSDELQNVPGLRNCAVVSKDGDRYRGEWLNEIACKNTDGKTFKFSQYAGRANFYSCPPPKR